MRLVVGFLLALFVLIGCDKDDDYSSILGEWLVEETGVISDYHRYSVSIQRMPTDSSLYKISNFYRTGTATELIIEYEDFTIEIPGQPLGNYYVQGIGQGIVQSDFRKITFKYQIIGNAINEEVVAEYTRK